MSLARSLILLLLAILQYPLWFGNGGVSTLVQLHQAVNHQQTENTLLRERNAALSAEVIDLKDGFTAVEERARSELGMVKSKETFYQVVPSADLGSNLSPVP